MRKPNPSKTLLSFQDGVLCVRFRENSVIEVADLIYAYSYARFHSNGKPYGVLFDSSSTHELSEEAIVYFANTCYSQNIIALAYLSKDLISKIRLKLFLIFERPPLKPKMFSDEAPAYRWIREQVDDVLLAEGETSATHQTC